MTREAGGDGDPPGAADSTAAPIARPPDDAAAAQPAHHTDRGFRNPPGSPKAWAGRGEFLRFLGRRWRRRVPPSVPPGHVLTAAETVDGLTAAAGGDSVTWLGHAAFLLRLGGVTILTDPFLSDRAAPVPGVGPRRFAPAPLPVDRLPPVDVLAVSHCHYDHLDRVAIDALPGKQRIHVVAPLRLGRFFRRRGFDRVSELDWHDRLRLGPLEVTATPAVHFSRRGPFDYNRTLWAGFVFAAPRARVYFAGDTAYGPVFCDVGARHGPVDLALVGIGAYEPRAIMIGSHATPEEAVRIARDVGARAVMGMHWGTIVLTDEPPFEPPERFCAAARAAGYADHDAWIMRIGETRLVTDGRGDER